MKHEPEHLRAIVDMGSNGIRFSVSTLQPPTARILPTLHQSRAAISLYDAQHSSTGERQPISDNIMEQVISSFKAFRTTCRDFGVPDKYIVVLATEATRTAANSEEFRSKIKDELGWDVTMLPKEEEGRIGAMGIRSSLPNVRGLVMDLGGGSTQLSWLDSRAADKDTMPVSGAVSMPYGAAAMTRRLADAEKTGSISALEQDIRENIGQAYRSLQLSPALAKEGREQGGLTLYLSGGGFRGWGYILMSRHEIQPYPIPNINGFKAYRQHFTGTQDVKLAAARALQSEDDSIFRISDRRASQVPAVAFLINALAQELPEIKEVRFCQGGVREGYLYSMLEASVQSQHPLVVATEPFAPQSPQPILDLLTHALPPEVLASGQRSEHTGLTAEILQAFANMMYYHSTCSKDVQASAALRSTTSGVLSSVHGLQHESRVLLALLLCARWGGEVPSVDQPFKSSLESLIESPWTLWWIKYLGAVASLIANVYPAGLVLPEAERLQLTAQYAEGKKGQQALHLTVNLMTALESGAFSADLDHISKLGKKKNWVDGKTGFGRRIELRLDQLHGSPTG